MSYELCAVYVRGVFLCAVVADEPNGECVGDEMLRIIGHHSQGRDGLCVFSLDETNGKSKILNNQSI